MDQAFCGRLRGSVTRGGWGEAGEVVLGGRRAVRSFLRGSLLYFNSATFPANKEKLVGGGEAMTRSAVPFRGAFLPACAPPLRAAEVGEGERGCGSCSPEHARIRPLICPGGRSHGPLTGVETEVPRDRWTPPSRPFPIIWKAGALRGAPRRPWSHS